jgi:PAS domain S-box-containing protein
MAERSDAPASTWHRPEEHFRVFVESVRDYAIFLLDPAGHVMSWNEGARRAKGYEAHEIIGRHFSQFFTPADVAEGKPENELARATADGRAENEGWRVRKDGSTFWANVVITALRDPHTGELRGFGKVTRDLTEHKLADERLRRSEEQFRLLVETVEDYAIFLLDPRGHVVTWNLGAQRAKGYTGAEIIGEYFGRFYTPEDQARDLPAKLLEHARAHGRAHNQGPRVRKDGTHFLADVVITAVHDHHGTLRGFSKVTRDITEQVRARKLEAEKIVAEKASQAKDDFLAVLSHELRTPLTPVLAAVSFLEESAETLSRAELADCLGAIRRNVLLEARIIDDLLDLTRISRDKVELTRESVDLNIALRDVLEICGPDAASKDLQVSLEFAAAEHWTWADSTRIRQVFWNLLSNAVKFTPREGRITARVTNPAPGRILVEITDTGIGFEPGQAERIFAPFEQGDATVTRRFGGLGLGLAITRHMVTMHGGSLAAHSEGRDRGATFRVELAAIAAPERRADIVLPTQAEPGQRLRILLVDDHEDTRRLLARVLASKGHRTSTAGSVEDALKCLATEACDVLVSDIGLPDGTGNELLAKARKLLPNLRSIAVSGFGMEDDVLRSMAAGFDAHFTKPIDLAELEAKLQELF